jgi:5-methylcytosine-specific restriction endonuclease McrA
MAHIAPQALGEQAWKRPRWGSCQVCGKKGWLVRHHVVYRQVVEREGGDPWDLDNSMFLGRDCRCHGRQHSKHTRLPLEAVPPDAVQFARELLGDDRAREYLARQYA